MELSRFDAFMPHGMCYMWRWDMLVLHIGADLLIALAYFSIPAAMIVLLRNRPDVPRRIFKLFVAFIMLCGLTHLISVVVIWEPIYLIQGLAKLATGIVSVVTAVTLWPLIPKAIAMPSIKDVEARNARIGTLNERLEERLDSLSTLAGGVSHEFNNLLTVIYGNADLLQEHCTTSEQRKQLQAITRASQRCTQICSKMLAYSGRGHFVLEEFDLGFLVEKTSLRLPDKHELFINIQRNLAPVQASQKQLQQLLHAVVENAEEAIEQGSRDTGRIEILVTEQFLSEHDIQQAAFENTAAPGTYVILGINDNGAGMDESVRNRAFDPYFSTKFTGRGLGLAAVQGIVRGHDGCLFLDSEPGKGTRVRVALPAGRGNSKQYQPARCPRPKTILMVDDEAPLLDLARSYLKEIGIKVLTAENSRTALELAKAHRDEIDAVILDYLMPQETGLQLLNKISKIVEVDTYLTSGFSRGEISDLDIRRLLTGFIAKPFSRKELQHIFGYTTAGDETIESA